MQENKRLIEVEGLKKYFNVGNKAVLKAVDDINFYINEGETLGLVGESGCGKSTAGRTIIKLYEPTAGKIIFNGEDISKLRGKNIRGYTKKAQMIFQDPYASLNPRMTVGDIIGEGIDIHKLYTGKDRTDKIYEMLHTVGLNHEHASRFPHEFSGGQRQRIGIARALAIEPKFIVCDEPISALDVSIQAQVINLLMKLQSQKNLTYLFIAHDLSMVKHISDRVVVMYLGSMMELAKSSELYSNPLHPYTQALMSAIPISDPDVEKRRERIILQGDVPSPINPPSGCKFRTRCKYAKDICANEVPKFREVESGHYVACHFAGEVGNK